LRGEGERVLSASIYNSNKNPLAFVPQTISKYQSTNWCRFFNQGFVLALLKIEINKNAYCDNQSVIIFEEICGIPPLTQHNIYKSRHRVIVV